VETKPVKDNPISADLPPLITRADRSKMLSKRFPEAIVEQLPVGRGNKEVGFVAWHHYARRLNELFPLEWGVSISHVTVVGKYLLMVVDVRILGVTYSGTGEAEAAKEDWGGAHAEAFSQAFRRACALPGLGLYWYGLEKMEKAMAASQPTMTDLMVTPESIGELPDTTPEVIDVTTLEHEPTETQMQRLAELGATGVFIPNELTVYRERMKQHFNKGAVGSLIREMKTLYETRTGNPFVSEIS